MPDSCDASARAYLLKPRRSRRLWAWWLLLHLVLGAAIVLASPRPWLTAAALGALAVHAAKRRPRASPLIVYAPGGPWALPAQGLFGLELSPRTRVGSAWAELVFEHPAAPRVLLLGDQLEPHDWRRLMLTLREPP